MDELFELIEEAKEYSGCRVKKEGEFYRLFEQETYIIQSFIEFIETNGYRVWIHEGPEIIENTMFYGVLAEVVNKSELSEEEREGYTVICGADYD